MVGVERVGRGVLTASHVLRVDGEQGLAVRGDHRLLAQVVLHAAVDEERAHGRLGLRGLLLLLEGWLGGVLEVGEGARVQVGDGPVVPVGSHRLLHPKHVALRVHGGVR